MILYLFSRPLIVVSTFFLLKRRSRHFNPHYRYSSNLTPSPILIIITQSQTSHLTLRTPNIDNQNQIPTKTQPLQYHTRLYPEDGKSHTVPSPNQLMYLLPMGKPPCLQPPDDADLRAARGSTNQARANERPDVPGFAL
jgi:hypothetical protein